MKYPVTTFVHVDDIPDTQESVWESNCGENPIANSTMREPSQCSAIASVIRHDESTLKTCCPGSTRFKSADVGCHSHSVLQCPESHCESLPRSLPMKTQCKSKGSKSQCSSVASSRAYDLTHFTPRACVNLTPCKPLVKTQCGSTSTPRENQSQCSSRNSAPRNLPTSEPHSANERLITQCSNSPITEPTPCQIHRECPDECSSYDVGHASHIPHIPPSPSTFDIPCIAPMNVATGTCTDYHHSGDIFGMVKLGENDVCYTSGTIEWVGRKRGYPINTGFKMIKETTCSDMKKMKTLDQTFTCDVDKTKDCDCADVLPTMSAIVDHLNALHEAVDIVDLRLNTLENVMTKNN